MSPLRSRLFLTIILLLSIASCANSSNTHPLSPELATNSPSDATSQGRYLWAFYSCSIDPDTGESSFVPVRSVANHWNVLKFLEYGPCYDCVKLTDVYFVQPFVINATIEITNPFQTKNLTGFDVRGVCIFESNHSYPVAGVSAPDRLLGGPELIVADGYTALYNPSTAGSGPGGLQGYLKGKMATDPAPVTILSGYKTFESIISTNTRKAFYSNDTIERDYTISKPSGPLTFGYAVDANWAPPTVNPVVDPMADFPPEANCPEPRFVMTDFADNTLNEAGGSISVLLDVYDWQGKDSHYPPVLECPDLFDGQVTTAFYADVQGGSQWSATIENLKLAPAGSYQCLVKIEDHANDSAPDWLDLTAYSLFNLPVAAAQPDHHELWYYHSINLLPDNSLQDAIDQLSIAKDAGYEKVVLADFKLGTIDIQSQTYWDHLASYVQAAENVGIEIIPSLVPIGYSDAVLCHDPNLIEGQPVEDCVFEVSGDEAQVWDDPATFVNNGHFENHSGDTFPAWVQMDGAGVSTFADTNTKHSGSSSIRFSNFLDGNGNGNDRIRQSLTVKPWNCYAVSIWIKTEDVEPANEIRVATFDTGVTKDLQYVNLGISSTQDWTHYYVIFNSQDQTTVQLYIGIWGGETGQFWIDDVTIENAGLINLIRRDGCPVTVTSEDGLTVYTEGVDYNYIEDPLMGHAGSYTGTFDWYHEKPVISLTPGSSINNGDKILVDYFHCTFVYDLQPACCLTHEGVYDIFEATLSKVDEIVNPTEVFIAVDELRCVNWCDLCQGTGKTPGQLLADTTSRIDQIAHEIDPAWRLIVWSDMYDPNHNAHDDYYLVNGTLEGSWDGLPADWDVGNWYRNNEDTLSFFSGRGNRQILCGYYDTSGPPWDITAWLDLSASYTGVYACMYTSWWKGFDDMASWADAVKSWDEENW